MEVKRSSFDSLCCLKIILGRVMPIDGKEVCQRTVQAAIMKGQCMW